MSTYILERKGKYLNERYQWQRLPHVFPEWHFGVVFAEAMQYRDRPQRVGEVIGGDLDTAKWTELDTDGIVL
jgi:hypothetical protein